MKNFAFALAGALAIAGPASAATLYSNDFDGNEFTAAGVTTVGSGPSVGGPNGTALAGAWNAQGWAGNFYRNDTAGNPAGLTYITLSGIGAHTSISIGGMLGLLDSWDSRNGSPAPDNLDIFIDGNLVASLTTNNASGSVEDYAGSSLVYHLVQADSNQFYSDTLADIGSMSWATFAHSGSSLTFGIRASGAGWQAGSDESWGIDNLVISAQNQVGGAVPEASTWAMMLLGFGIAGSAVRRRQRTHVRFA